jgi:hypothetical protein
MNMYFMSNDKMHYLLINLVVPIRGKFDAFKTINVIALSIG